MFSIKLYPKTLLIGGRIIFQISILIYVLSGPIHSCSADLIKQEGKEVLCLQKFQFSPIKNSISDISSNSQKHNYLDLINCSWIKLNKIISIGEYSKPFSNILNEEESISNSKKFQIKRSVFLILCAFLIFSILFLLTVWNQSINASLGISQKLDSDDDEIYLEMNSVYFIKLYDKVSGMVGKNININSMDKLLQIDHIQNSKLRSVIRVSLIKRINLCNKKRNGFPLVCRKIHPFQVGFIVYEIFNPHSKNVQVS